MCKTLLPMLALLAVPAPALAAGYDLLSAGLEARIGETTLLGEKAPDSFQEYDLRGTWSTPLERTLLPRLTVGARLLGSVGLFEGSGKTGAVASLVPLLAFGSPDRRYSFDGGIGLGLLSRYRYEQQNFGGHLQFALTVGVHAPLYRRVGIAYRFMHYSDAGSYGPHTVGADLHMAGVSYRF